MKKILLATTIFSLSFLTYAGTLNSIPLQKRMRVVILGGIPAGSELSPTIRCKVKIDYLYDKSILTCGYPYRNGGFDGIFTKRFSYDSFYHVQEIADQANTNISISEARNDKNVLFGTDKKGNPVFKTTEE